MALSSLEGTPSEKVVFFTNSYFPVRELSNYCAPAVWRQVVVLVCSGERDSAVFRWWRQQMKQARARDSTWPVTAPDQYIKHTARRPKRLLLQNLYASKAVSGLAVVSHAWRCCCRVRVSQFPVAPSHAWILARFWAQSDANTERWFIFSCLPARWGVNI